MASGQFFDGSGDNIVSSGNSSNANLAAAGVFTGTGEEVVGYGNITVTAFASHAGSFTVQWSDDNSTWRADGETYAVSATTLKVVKYGPSMRYFRVVYTNGGTLTTTLVIQTVYRVGHTKPDTHRLGNAMNDDTDAEVVKAVLTGFSPSGGYINAELTDNNEQMTADVLDNGGIHAALTVGTSAVLACAGGAATNLVRRKCLTVYNGGTVLIYWGHTNAVTTSTGTPIAPGSTAIFAVGPNTNVFLISGTASQNTRITEVA